MGKIKSMLQGLNIPSGMGTPWDPPANTESSAGEIFDLKRREKTEREGERARRSNKDEHIRGKYLRSISKKSHR